MTKHYVRRPHPAQHQMWEYRSVIDWTPWRHAGYLVLLVLALVLGVLATGGTFALGVQHP